MHMAVIVLSFCQQGKTLCYVLLPYVFDHLRGIARSSIVICVSPLISLMMDEVKSIHY